MKSYEILLVLAMLSAGAGVAHRDSMAIASESEHHHHGKVAAGTGYKRAFMSYQTPDVKLLDANGKRVSLRDRLDGDHPVMLNFIFTTCTTICPVTTATFSMVQDRLGAERARLHLVSISIDPEHDTPAKLSAYAKKFGAGGQWSMLTGSFEDSIAVQRAFDVYAGDKMNHRPVTFLRNRPGKPWLRIDGFASADELLREYRKLASN